MNPDRHPNFFTRAFGLFAPQRPLRDYVYDPFAQTVERLAPEPEASAPPERFPHAMVDIETMANHTSRSLILSVAAIPFALEPTGPRFGPALLRLPELSEQLATGRLVTAATQDFWQRQSPAARRHWNGPRPRDPAWSIVPDLRAFLMANTIGAKAQVWFRGQGFDPANLDNLALEHGVEEAWPAFWMLRDQRTAVTFFPRQRNRPADVVIEGDAHDPVHDCRKQIWALWEHAPAEAIGLEPVSGALAGLVAAAQAARAAAPRGGADGN